MKQPKKKKRSRVSRNINSENHTSKIAAAAAAADVDDKEEQRMLNNLLDAFGSASVSVSQNPKKSEILDHNSTTSCSSSSGNYDVGSSSSSSVSEFFGDPNYNFIQEQKSRPKMKKKVIASAGTVSTVLGKDYVRSIPKKGSSKLKGGFHEERLCKEEAEQFLCSMLGDDCELSLAVVGDVLCQCGYNIDKALDVLLEMSASSREPASGYYESTIKEDEHLHQSNSGLIDRTSDSTDNSSLTGNHFRNLSRISESSEDNDSTETGNMDSELPQKLLESLFNMPTPKTVEHEPNAMNWRNIAKKMSSLGQRFETADREQRQLIHAKENEYQVLRESAREHWDSMKSYYQKAVTAYSSGKKEYASYLSEQGRVQNKMAREADEKASQDIFTARNKTIENMITIDLHGQHIKQAMKLLKLHLLFGAYVKSVRSFRVITGCGSHGVGKSKLKNSVIDLLKKEGIAWSEENRGTLLIRLDGQTDFSFLDSASDTD